jgi:hypothetical protein
MKTQKEIREKILERILKKLNKEVYYEEPYKTWANFKEHEKIIEKATGVKSMADLIEEVIDISQNEGHTDSMLKR